jgi:hypothetical protein
MKRVHNTEHGGEAHLICGFLESHGIEAVVGGDLPAGVWGELPVALCAVWISDDTRFEEADRLIRDFLKDAPARPHMEEGWRCTDCGEASEGQFTACWKCGRERPLQSQGPPPSDPGPSAAWGPRGEKEFPSNFNKPSKEKVGTSASKLKFYDNCFKYIGFAIVITIAGVAFDSTIMEFIFQWIWIFAIIPLASITWGMLYHQYKRGQWGWIVTTTILCILGLSGFFVSAIFYFAVMRGEFKRGKGIY